MLSAIARARTRPGWLVPIRTDSDRLVDGRLYIEWGNRVRESSEPGVKLYRIGRAADWYAWIGGSRWFEYVSDEGMAFAAACSEILWKRPDQTWRSATDEHFAQFAPMLADEHEMLQAFTTTLVYRRGDGESTWPRLLRDTPSWAVLADVERAADDDVVDRLKAVGARAVPHEMVYPKYRSWARIKPGQSLELRRDGAVARYVPHRRLGEVEMNVERVRLRWTEEAFAEAQWQAFRQRAELVLGRLHGETLPAVSRRTGWSDGTENWSTLAVYEYRFEGETIRGVIGDHRLLDHFVSIVAYRLDDQRDEATRLMVDGIQRIGRGESIAVRLGEVDIQIRPATRDDLDGEWLETPHGWWHLRTEIDYALAAAYRWYATCPELEITYDREQADRNPRATLRATVSETLSELLSAYAAKHASFHLVQGSVLKLCDKETIIVSITRDEPVTAPFSERGTLTVTGETEAVTTLLSDVFGVRELHEEAGWGRCQPPLDAYAATKAPAVPDGCMVLHGMTGVAVWGQALARFERIIESGGLLSVSERRRRGFGSTTMSPLGDMASGVDWGVPCTVGTKPSYGKWIIFGLKPHVLTRRDLWFSDQDFGGGKCRYDSYAAYAAELGQKSIFLPCPPEGRQRHLAKTHALAYNEVWLRWSVGWDDIDTVFVTDSGGLDAQVRRRVDTAMAEGLVPDHVRVVSFTDAFGETRDEEVMHHDTLLDAVVIRARELAVESLPNPTLQNLEAYRAAFAPSTPDASGPLDAPKTFSAPNSLGSLMLANTSKTPAVFTPSDAPFSTPLLWKDASSSNTNDTAVDPQPKKTKYLDTESDASHDKVAALLRKYLDAESDVSNNEVAALFKKHLDKDDTPF